jgi:hypothetical protein
VQLWPMVSRVKKMGFHKPLARGPNAEPEIKLTKQQVAQREIDAAIDLFLAGADGVPVYVLAMAALEVVEGVAKSIGVRTVIAEYKNGLEPEFRKSWVDLVNGPFNWMKHGGSGDETLSDFMPSSPYIAIALAFSTYWHVFGEPTPRTSAFREWLAVHHPDLHVAG